MIKGSVAYIFRYDLNDLHNGVENLDSINFMSIKVELRNQLRNCDEIIYISPNEERKVIRSSYGKY